LIRVRELFFVSVLVQFGDTDLIQFVLSHFRIENVGFRGVDSDQKANKAKQLQQKLLDNPQIEVRSAQFIFLRFLNCVPAVYCVFLTFVSYLSHVLLNPGQDPQLTRQASTAWFALQLLARRFLGP
jgi:hypothetical protein